MSAPSTAMRALSAALLTTTPACQGDDRFTDDDQNPDDLADICNQCEMFTICQNYAQIVHPPAGIWAKRRWNRSTYKPRTTTKGTP